MGKEENAHSRVPNAYTKEAIPITFRFTVCSEKKIWYRAMNIKAIESTALQNNMMIVRFMTQRCCDGLTEMILV